MPANYIDKLAETNGVSKKKLETHWDKAKQIAKKRFPKVTKGKEPDHYWKYVSGIIKRMTKSLTSESGVGSSAFKSFLERHGFYPKHVMDNAGYCVYNLGRPTVVVFYNTGNIPFKDGMNPDILFAESIKSLPKVFRVRSPMKTFVTRTKIFSIGENERAFLSEVREIDRIVLIDHLGNIYE